MLKFETRTLLPVWKNRLTQVIEFFGRYPRVMALYGFISGIASFFLVDRQARLGGILAALMLVSWLWLVLENLLTQGLARRFGLQLPPPLLRFATQLIHQESLFFSLPFFAITTTWNSGQAVFTALLGGAALVSIIDPIYNGVLATRRWLYLAFHSLALFAVLLAAPPLILQLSTEDSYLLATLTTVVLAFPSLARVIPATRWWRSMLLLGMVLVLGVTVWLARVWVPPATLWMTRVAVTPTLQEREPGPSLKQLSVADLQQGLYAYTAINAPRGLQERIYHRWTLNGVEVDRIALDIRGGRESGYRAWTHKEHFPEDASGRWRVEVLTEGGQLIGVLRFTVR